MKIRLMVVFVTLIWSFASATSPIGEEQLLNIWDEEVIVPGEQLINPNTTMKPVALMCRVKFADEPQADMPLPYWADSLLDLTAPRGISAWYRDFSYTPSIGTSKLILDGKTYGNGDQYFTSSKSWEEWNALYPNGYYWEELNMEMVQEADIAIDFSRFDYDNNGVVDFLFMIIRIPYGLKWLGSSGIASLGIGTYKTNDYKLIDGVLTQVVINQGATERFVFEAGDFTFPPGWEDADFRSCIGLTTHEYMHFLRTLSNKDITHTPYDTKVHGSGLSTLDPAVYSASVGGYGNGSYGFMPGPGWGCYGLANPYTRLAFGWGDVIDVSSNMINQPIKDYCTTGEIYRFWINYPNEYFLCTNHQQISTWEDKFLDRGLLIWHIDTLAPIVGVDGAWGGNYHEMHKWIDVECADGLWDNLGAWPLTGVVNTIDGRDNLDFYARVYEEYTAIHNGNFGDATDFWGPSTGKTEFAPWTNPSSMCYNGSQQYSWLGETAWPQNIYSNIGVLNIRQPDPGDPTMYADLYIDVPPIAPSQLTAALNAPPLAAKLIWAQNTEPDLAGYDIYRSVNVAGNWVLLGSTASNEYSDETVEQGKTYYYAIKAYDLGGNRSEYSASTGALVVPLLLSTKEDATGYNGGVKYAYNREFGLAYSSGPLKQLSGTDSVYYAKSADASSWIACNAVMPGKYPALAIDYMKGLLPNAIDAVPSPLGSRYRYIASDLTTVSEEVATLGWTGTSSDNINANIYWNDYFYEQVGGYYKPGYMSPPAIAKDANHNIHLAYEKGEIWKDANNVVHWWWALVYQKMDYMWSPLESDVVAYAEGSSGGEINKSPSLVLDAYAKPHIVWSQDGAVNYSVKQNGVWSAPRTMNTSGRPGKEPFIDLNGNKIQAVWVEELSDGLGEIWKQERDVNYTNPNIWDGYPDPRSNTPTQDSRWPQLAGGHVIWSEQVGGINWEIYLDGQNISNTPSSSRFSQSCFRQTTTASYVYNAWTEGDAAPYQIKFSTLTVPAAPTYAIDIAQEEASPYTIYRDGDTTYPSGVSIDYAFTELSYSIADLDTSAPFDLEIIGYHESSEEWKQQVEIDGKWKHLMKVMAHEPETLKVRIPPAFLKDGKVDIKIIKKSGDYAAIAKLGLYQYEQENGGPSKSGGAQFANNAGTPAASCEFMLKQNTPNPFTGRTTISYQLPVQQMVKLNVYNIAGQLVKTLVDGLQSSGIHNIAWDGKDKDNQAVCGGVYFYKLKTGDIEQTKRMIIIK